MLLSGKIQVRRCVSQLQQIATLVLEYDISAYAQFFLLKAWSSIK